MGNKAKPISLNILDIAQRVNKLEKSGGGGGGGGAADDVTYDPTASGLQATNVQDAIDALSSDIFEMSADDVSYDNTDSGLSSETVQGAIDETVNKIDTIDVDLNGFKFYPAGTAIVGLVSDDSPYTDANGNYILAASTTGQSMIDGVTYKSIDSTIDARGKVGADSATPFKSGGGTTLLDINPNKVTNDFYVLIPSDDKYFTIPVCGYKKIAFYIGSARTLTYYFVLADGTHTTSATANMGANAWTDYIDIPEDAVRFEHMTNSIRTVGNLSLLAN